MHIRQATYADIEALMRIFEGARKIMRDSGNMDQWNDGYPSERVVRDDITAGNCHIICDETSILGTMALIPGPDPTYSHIEGCWSDESPYYVIHRIATGAPGRDIARKMFDWAFEHIGKYGYSSIRIDTHRDNCIMKHILDKYGFTECGVIYLESGAARDAYCCTSFQRRRQIPSA